MIASSTNEPIAMHIPPNVMVLMFIPRRCITMKLPRSESGMAMTEMIVVLKLPKKRRRMTITKTAPSTKARATLLTEASMKSA